MRFRSPTIDFAVCYSPPPDQPPPKQPKAELSACASLDDSANLSDDQTSIVSRVEWSTNLSLGELVPVGGGAPIILLKPSLVLGRHGNCDIPIPDATVSGDALRAELRQWLLACARSRQPQLEHVSTDNSASHSGSCPANVLALAKCRYLLNYTPTGDSPPLGNRAFVAAHPFRIGRPRPLNWPARRLVIAILRAGNTLELLFRTVVRTCLYLFTTVPKGLPCLAS